MAAPRTGTPPALSVGRAVPRAARAAILEWYDAHGRHLPFRGTRDAYAVLVSEVMAQQTQIDRAGERWSAFVARFPTVVSLAAATPANVLRAWAGLGYNRRGLNLWRAAKLIVERHDGALPHDPEALAALPGIGPYTARAVAAIAFGQRVGAVDTNVRQVLSRMAFGDRPASSRTIQDLADAVVPADRAGDWTHAVMDVGATFCRPRPRCQGCPVLAWCRFARGGSRDPGGSRRPTSPTRPFAATSRWLRGRILQRLTAVDTTAWTRFDGPIGSHGAERVAAALSALERDGLIELDGDDATRARLALA